MALPNFEINPKDLTDQEFSDFLQKEGILLVEDGSVYLEENEFVLFSTYLEALRALNKNVVIFDSYDEYREYEKRFNLDMGCKELVPYLIKNKAIQKELTLEEIPEVFGIDEIVVKR